jgi:hypothetical protein
MNDAKISQYLTGTFSLPLQKQALNLLLVNFHERKNQWRTIYCTQVCPHKDGLDQLTSGVSLGATTAVFEAQT